MSGPRYSQAGLQALKAGSRIVPARQQLNLLAAVDNLPRRWLIRRTLPVGELRLAELTLPARPAGWRVTAPTCRDVWIGGHIFACACDWFPTHAAAIAYATSRARADQLAAITSSEGAGQ